MKAENAAYLMRRQNAERRQAMIAPCPEQRSRYEELARAYGKIIAVLDREIAIKSRNNPQSM